MGRTVGALAEFTPSSSGTEAAAPRPSILRDGREFPAEAVRAPAERTVVVVDGSDAFLAMLEYAARPAATRCLAFTDGAAAMAWLTNGEAPRDALVVFDLDLPGIDAMDAVRRLAEADGHRYRVLATTTRRNESRHIQALRAGAVDCLLKPLSFPLFAARVERLLALP